jgi:hypothetical protein
VAALLWAGNPVFRKPFDFQKPFSPLSERLPCAVAPPRAIQPFAAKSSSRTWLFLTSG